jgi:phosphatidylglycerol:prolipoprotein diacylglycerol transferase
LTLFSVLLALGAVLGLIWIYNESPPRQQQASLIAGILVLLGGLVGARGAYVAVHWEYFQEYIIEIPQVWLGGLSWPGALAGGILSAVIVVWLAHIPFGVLADRLLPLLASLSVAVWLGCWLSGCAYGPETSIGFSTKDELGVWKMRLPLQLIAALLTVLFFLGIERFRHRKSNFVSGLAASIGLGGLSLILLGASLLRVDPYPLHNGLRLETWAALIFLIVSVLLGILVIVKSRRNINVQGKVN